MSRFLIPLAAGALALSACNGDDDDDEKKVLIKVFTASPVTVDQGATTTLQWKVENAKTISISSTPGGVVLDSSADLEGTVVSSAITQETTFELTATGDSGTAKSTVTVKVNIPGTPIIDSFSATPVTINVGDSSTLRWQTTNATSVDIVDEGGASVVASGEPDDSLVVTITAAGTKTYTLTAKDDAGNTTDATATITVNPLMPNVVSFTATPATITEGDSSTLSWEVTNATDITITDSGNNQVHNSTDLTGTFSVSPTANETYTLTASLGTDTDTADVTVTVNAAPTPPEITSFAANPSTVDLGNSSDLAWVVVDADSLEISVGGTVIHTDTAGTGSFTVTPTITTDYTLTAINTVGNDTEQTTVTVTAGAPIIRSFDGTPNPVAMGGDVTLSWSTFAADSVRILRGMTEIHATTMAAASGTHVVPQTATSTTYVLEATNTTGTNTFSVVVFAHDMPVINSLDATPLAIPAGVTTTATITWDVDNVSSLVLNANGAAVANFPGVSTTTAAVSSMGSFGVAISQMTVFELVATSAAGSVNASVTVISTISEIEPNNTSTMASGLPGDGSGASGEIDVGSDEDWYSVVVPDGGWVFAETNNGMGGCDLDTQLTLTPTTGDDSSSGRLAYNDDGGEGLCSLIDPRSAAGATNLPAGTYFIKVGSYSSNTGTYILTVEVGPPACGNEIGETGEQCEDGNTDNGDGCDSNCQVEIAGQLQPPGGTVQVDLPTATAFTTIEVAITTPGQSITATVSDGMGGCLGDMTLVLFQNLPNGLYLNLGNKDDDGPGGCPAIFFPADGFATNLSTATYSLLLLNESGAAAMGVTVDVGVIDPFCSNNVVETNAGEQCDDGNLMTGDGCDNMCLIEGVNFVESEPNDDANAAFDVGAVSTTTIGIYGAIVPAGDIDWFRFTLTDQAVLRAETMTDPTAAPGSRCNKDTQMRLFESDGTTQIGWDDDDGDGYCSLIDEGDAFALLDAGTYYIRINDYGNNSEIDPYFLFLTAIQRAPSFTSTPVILGAQGQVYTYTVTVDGIPTPTLAATTIPAWLTFDPASGVLTGTPQNTDVGQHNVEITADNGIAPAATQPFIIDVLAAADPPIFSEDFETIPTTWNIGFTTGSASDWDVGVPTTGPGAAYMGNSCAGTNLGGDYATNTMSFLETPVLDLTGVLSPAFRFHHWYITESNWDGGNLKISFNGGTSFTSVTETSMTQAYDGSLNGGPNSGEDVWMGDNSSAGWTTVTVDLAADLSGQPVDQVVIRFEFSSDGSSTRAGWFLDEFHVGQITGLP